MKTSFVIPAHNEEKYILPCIEAIHALRGLSDFEIVVVDNNSTDHTASLVANHFPNVRVVKEEKKGPNFARQKGFQESVGEIVIFFDADTRAPLWWYQKVMGKFETDPKLSAVSGTYVFYELDSFFWRFWQNYIYNYICAAPINFLFYHSVRTPLFFGGNMAIRRKALEDIGGVDTSYQFYADDTNIGRRLSARGRVAFLSTLYVYASARRLKKEGTLRMFTRYSLNFLWEALLHKPFTK